MSKVYIYFLDFGLQLVLVDLLVQGTAGYAQSFRRVFHMPLFHLQYPLDVHTLELLKSEVGIQPLHAGGF